MPTTEAHHARHRMIEQGVAVGSPRARPRSREHTSGSALIFDHHLLTEHVGELLRGGARGEVDPAAGRRHHELDRFSRKAVLRRRADRQPEAQANAARMDRAIIVPS